MHIPPPEQEVEEAARKAVAEVATKNSTEAEVDIDFSPEEVEEHNQGIDNLKSNSTAYRKIYHNPYSATTDFPWIERGGEGF